MAHFLSKTLLKNYELIEHTADIGIKIEAPSLKELFKQAALAMFDIIAEPAKQASRETKTIKLKEEAGDQEELFIRWLNELLSLSGAKELIFSDFKIKRLTKRKLEAQITGSDIRNYRVNTEIKAATYHALRLEKTESGWKAQVIFDV